MLHIVFKLAGTEYVVPAAEVLQMEAYEGATPVPGSLPHVAGIVQVRGRVVPVVDLRARFGLPTQERSAESRLVVALHRERPVALLVDSARQVLELDPTQLEPPPPVVSQQTRGFVKAVARLDQRLLMLVDIPQIIGEDPVHGEAHHA
jgi:purine-binding chemotaxis protein CheW